MLVSMYTVQHVYMICKMVRRTSANKLISGETIHVSTACATSLVTIGVGKRS